VTNSSIYILISYRISLLIFFLIFNFQRIQIGFAEKRVKNGLKMLRMEDVRFIYPLDVVYVQLVLI